MKIRRRGLGFEARELAHVTVSYMAITTLIATDIILTMFIRYIITVISVTIMLQT